MTALLPRTLFGQTLLALLVGIGLALAAGAWIYTSARQEAVRAVGALAAAERIVNLSRLVEELPRDWRGRIVAGASDPSFRVELADARPRLAAAAPQSEAAAAITALLEQALPGRQVAVVVRPGGGPRPDDHPEGGAGNSPGRGPGYGGGPGAGHGHHMGGRGPTGPPWRGQLARAAGSWRGLEVAVELPDAQWLAFSTALPDTGPAMSPRLLVALLVSTAMIAALTAWAVRRATAPLRLLSQAAERLGRNVDSAPLAVGGTIELRHATTAFNGMQARLRRLIDNRTLMLAAISHDLRTELTRLRLRAEVVEPAEERERMLTTIGEMEAMLTATLSFARDEAASEPAKRTDVGALVASMVDDLADAGAAVSVAAMAEGAIAEVKPVALRRAIANLIDNALKYGARARVSLIAAAGGIVIAIDDDGPGIDEAELVRVLQPFVRLEASRSRDTGGMGLGLAIAASVADAHGGKLRLANRAGGGLRAELEIPAMPAAG